MSSTYSQECGQDYLIKEFFSLATSEEKADWLEKSVTENLNFSNHKRKNQSINIPIHAYVIRKSNGKGGSNENEMMRALDVLNEDFSSTPFQFYYHDIEYINSDQFFVIFDTVESSTLNNAYNNPNALNMYVAGYLLQGFNGFALLPWTSNSNQLFLTHHAINTAIYAHEIGHYLGLLHTHSTIQGAEFVNGTNCSAAGDFVCDTPADPLITTVNVDSMCLYTGTATDINGDLYIPEPRNIMSYARMECRDLFTAGQITRMNYFYDNFRINELGNLSQFVPANSCPILEDDDADGVCNANDTCSGGFDVDMDFNGIIDACESCPSINFEQSNVQLYDQDGSNDFWYNWTWINPYYLHLQENSWKALAIDYNVTANTRIAFDFKSSIEAEIHELSFDNDLIFPPEQRFILFGNEIVNGPNTFDYPYIGAGDFQHYNIHLGNYFTGFMKYLILTVDEDNSSGGHIPGNSFFRNVRIFEDTNGDNLCSPICMVGTACDDGDICTVGETLDVNCFCGGGTFSDSDGDGVCDAYDQCGNFDDNLIGTDCDDNDACTVGEVYGPNCLCSGGILIDSDGDSICDQFDTCPNGDDLLDNNNNGIPDECDPGYIPVSDCENDIYLNGMESLFIYQSSNRISSEQMIDGLFVKYSSVNEINLLANFEVKAGTIFKAEMNGCN